MEPSKDDLIKDDFFNSGWEEVIADCDRRTCQNYASRFAGKAIEAEKSGDPKTQQVFKLLSGLTSLHFKPDTPEEPLTPFDLDETHLNFLSSIVLDVSDAELKARIADVLCLSKPNHQTVDVAISAYLESAKQLEDSMHWSAAVKRIERALQLAAKWGRNSERFTKVVT